jgi:hypothetical protein
MRKKISTRKQRIGKVRMDKKIQYCPPMIRSMKLQYLTVQNNLSNSPTVGDISKSPTLDRAPTTTTTTNKSFVPSCCFLGISV